MAKVRAGEEEFATSPRPIPARVQLLAVAWLRWRLFVNTIRRPRTGRSPIVSLLLTILLQFIVYSMFAAIAIGPILGSGFLAWEAVASGHRQAMLALFAGISALWQFFAVNGLSIAANLPSFDPSSLTRFPLPFGRYLLLRTLFGLLIPSTIVGSLALLAAAVGIGIADHALALPALIVLAVYAWTNILFSRMLAAWLERWLAARRFREAFGVLMVLFFLGVQLLNLRTPSLARGASGLKWLALWRECVHFLRWLPPGLACNSILRKGHPVAELAQFFALLAYAVLFLAVFALRLHKQFLGEYLGEGSVRATPAASPSRRLSQPPTGLASPVPILKKSASELSPIIAGCLRKEWLDLRSSGSQLLAMLTPLLFVFILGVGIFRQFPRYFLPAALAYVLLGLLPRLYNIFGADGSGVQLYLLAPIRLRDVVLAKNMAHLMLIVFQVVLAWTAVMLLTSAPIGLSTQISAALWLVFVVAANLALGTLRSIQAPRGFVPRQTPQTRTRANRTSSLLVVATFVVSLLLQVPVTLVCTRLGLPWLAIAIFATLAAAAVISYALLLSYADQLILSYRDVLAEELCK